MVGPTRAVAIAALMAGYFGAAWASDLDRRWNRDESGIWARPVQESVRYGLIAASLGGALIEGSTTRLGRTFWRSTESAAIEMATVAVLKPAFSRARPRQGGDPDLWFQRNGRQSFPSDEVALATAAVAPFILEYRHSDPGIWALSLVPLYVGIARMKSQAHWQTDVLASVGIGLATSAFVRTTDRPFVFALTGNSVYVGLRYRW